MKKLAFLFLLFLALSAVAADPAPAAPIGKFTSTSPQTILSLECPLTRAGQNKTAVYAFVFENGKPKEDPDLRLFYEFNKTGFKEIEPRQFYAVNGSHLFVFDTTKPGPYRLYAKLENMKTEECAFVLFGKEPSLVGETDLLIVLLVALCAYLLAKKK